MDKRLTQWRTAKDDAFGSPKQSPLTPEQIAQFQGLHYFPEDPSLRFEPTVEPYDPQEMVEMETSTGETATYIRWGHVRFTVDGQAQALTVFRDPAQQHWFLPFRDATSGTETYGAGRYLEPESGKNDTLILDFNYAYNPFCAYNAQWTCPLPPAENRLPVPIPAGGDGVQERVSQDARKACGPNTPTAAAPS